MARKARLVVPGHPHHVTQRGVRRMAVFLGPDDYKAYLDLLGDAADRAGTQIWAYCLMPNHVHLIVVPSDPDGLRAALGETHRRYTRLINAREGWQGHLWQERFHSFAMDEPHLLACTRYVELNPVRAGLVKRPEAWTWSSAKAHLKGTADPVLSPAPPLPRVADWREFLADGLDDRTLADLRRHGRTGHPLGAPGYYTKLERLLGREIRPRRPGRPKARPADGDSR